MGEDAKSKNAKERYVVIKNKEEIWSGTAEDEWDALEKAGIDIIIEQTGDYQ